MLHEAFSLDAIACIPLVDKSVRGSRAVDGSRALPLAKLENRGFEALPSHPVTSVDLSVRALRLVADGSPRFDHLVFCQSYPDFEAMTPPMQKAVHHSGVSFGALHGFSHLREVAALECFRLTSWVAKAGEQTLAVVTERAIFENDRRENFSIGMRLTNGPGALELTESWTSDREIVEIEEGVRILKVEGSPLVFWMRFIDEIKHATPGTRFLFVSPSNHGTFVFFKARLRWKPLAVVEEYSGGKHV